MPKRMASLMVVVALVSGGIVASSLYRHLTSPSQSAKAPSNIPVVVAKADLRRGAVLTKDQLTTAMYAPDQLPEGAFRHAETLIGRVVKEPVSGNQPVLPWSLVETQEAPGPAVAVRVPPGYRAVGVSVDIRGGAQQFLRPGDHVDVIVTVEETTAGASGGSDTKTIHAPRSDRLVSSKMLLQDIEVLDVPSATQGKEEKGSASRTVGFQPDTGKERMPVILALTPADAERLSLAMQIGTIQLLKRGPTDDRVVQTSGATQDTLYSVKAPQVLIEVRFAEVDRSLSRNLGIDYVLQDKDFTQSNFMSGALVPQVPSTKHFTRPTSTVTDLALSSTVSQLFEWRKGPDFSAALNALAEKGLVRILAEPNLLAVSGQEASFLAGGEFPVPVVQSSTGTTVSNSVTIEFKEFGVRLTFKPDVVNDREIRLFVAPEVSILDFGSAAVKIAGFSIPSLLTRRANTTVQMASGESLVIGGLLSQMDTRTNREVPYLGSIPILGKLFSSEKFKNEESELIVLVTPRLVKPTVMDVKPRLNDPKAVSEALKQQLGAPPYPDARAEAIRRAILQADEEQASSAQPAAPVQEAPVSRSHEPPAPSRMSAAIQRELTRPRPALDAQGHVTWDTNAEE